MNGPILPFTRESAGTLCRGFPHRHRGCGCAETDASPGPTLFALPTGCAEHAMHRGTILFFLLEMMLHPLPTSAAGNDPTGCTMASSFSWLWALTPWGTPRAHRHQPVDGEVQVLQLVDHSLSQRWREGWGAAPLH